MFLAHTDVCSLPAADHMQLVTNLQVARQRKWGTKCPESSCLEKIPSHQLAGKKKKSLLNKFSSYLLMMSQSRET